MTALEASSATKALTAGQIQERLATELNSKEDAKALLINSGIVTQKELEENATIQVTAAKLNEAVANGTLSASDAGVIAGALGITGVNTGAAISFDVLTAAIIKNIKYMGLWLVSNPVGWLALFGIALGMKKYSDSIEETRQQLKETGEQAKSTVDQIKSDFESLSSTTNDVKERYAELAQEVENLGKVNQSRGTLSTEDYEEFLGLSNQLAELYPQLTKGYDDNGNAILNLSGDVNTIVGSLNDLVSVQQRLANQEIIDQMPDIWSGYKVELEDYNKELAESERNVEKHLQWADDIRNRSSITLYDENANNLLRQAAREVGIMSSDYGNAFYDVDRMASEAGSSFNSATWDFSKLTDEEYEKFLDKVSELGAEYEDAVQMAKGDISAANADMSNYINTWLSTEWNFSKMNSNMQNIVKDALLSTNWVDSLPDDVDSGNWDEVSNWLQREFLYAINDIDNEQIESALVNAFNSNFTADSLQGIINQLTSNEYGFTEDNPLILYLQTKLTERTEDVNSVKAKLQNEYDGMVDQLSSEDLKIASEFVTVNEKDILTWDELIAKVEEYKASLKKDNKITDLLSITDTVNNINTKLKPALDSLVDTYTTLFSEEGYEWKPINVEEFASIGEQLDSLSEEFGINVPTEDYENFVKILNDSTTTAEQAQQAFDDLATSMINNSNVVELTDENFDVLRNSLENLGVTNATEVLEELKQIKEEVTLAGYDLANMTDEEIQKFLETQESINETTQYLITHLIQKNQLNSKPLDTYKDIVALEKECSALKATGELYEKIAQLKSLYYAAERNLISPEVSLAQIKEVKAEVDDMLNNQYEYKFDFKYDGNTVGKNKDKSSSAESEKDTKETFNWIETLISRIQRNITNLGKTVSATYKSWSTRNNTLAQEMGEINREISAQSSAYNEYMAKANNVGLSDHYKNLVMNGGLVIEDITDETLREQIEDFQNYYEKALDASDAIEDLRANLADLAKTKFDNISKQYEDKISLITHNTSMLDKFVSQSEAAGFWASEVYYQSMVANEQENINELQAEYNALIGQWNENINSGIIEKYSEQWYEMRIQIDGVEEALQDANTKLIEFHQTLQQIYWDLFDRGMGYKNNIIDEAKFLVDLLDNYDLHNDNGLITDKGLSVQGLYAMNYNVYMEEAEKYAQEIQKINSELAKDSYDSELIDRRNELIGLQQESIQNAMSEKEAILDLAKAGYDKLLDSLQKLIDKRKEALNAEKDLYSYQKSIEEKTDVISDYKKQLQSYAGDNSEEAKATIQKLQVSLSDAEEDLEQTEYDKWLSDQESMLDNLYSQTEEWINSRLDKIGEIVYEAIEATNSNASTISETLHEVADSVGYTLSTSMEEIWDTRQNSINGITDIVKTYGDILSETHNTINTSINNGATAVQSALKNIDADIMEMIEVLNKEAKQNTESIAQEQQSSESSQNNNSSPAPTPTPTSTPSSFNSSSSNGITFNGGLFYEDSYQGGRTGNNRNQWTGNEVEVTHTSRTGMVHIVDKETGTVLGWVDPEQLNGYASGTSNAQKGWKWVGEGKDGNEIILDKNGNALLTLAPQLYNFKGGEQVINGKETSELLTSNLMPLSADQLWGNIVKTPKLPEMVSRNTNNNVNYSVDKIELVLPNVKDYDSLVTEMQHDKRFERIVQSMTVDRIAGKGSLDKFKL